MSDLSPIRVMLVEDSAVIRFAVKLSLKLNPDISIVGEACDGRSAVSMAQRLQPDVALVDIGLPVLDGIQATNLIKRASPQIKILMFTSYESDADFYAAMAAGADGYCLKSLPAGELVFSITKVIDAVSWAEWGLGNSIIRPGCSSWRRPLPRSSSSIPFDLST